MENTLENKAKFFAHYWGQAVVDFTESNILTRDELNTCYVSIPNISFPMLKYSCLLLTPISSITDEDAVKVCTLQDWEYYTEPLSRDDRNDILDQIRSSVRKQWVNYRTIDYLRSKGYAVPYMGLSADELDEYGWIKIKEA